MCRLRRCSANDITIGMAQWVEYLTCKRLVVSLSTIKNSRCFHDHKTYPHCLVLVRFRNRLKYNLNKTKISKYQLKIINDCTGLLLSLWYFHCSTSVSHHALTQLEAGAGGIGVLGSYNAAVFSRTQNVLLFSTNVVLKTKQKLTSSMFLIF